MHSYNQVITTPNASKSGNNFFPGNNFYPTMHSSNASIQRSPLDNGVVENTDDIHRPLVERYAQEIGIPVTDGIEYTEAYREWLANFGHAQSPTLDNSCGNQTSRVREILRQTLNWIDDIYDQLIAFQAHLIFQNPGATTPPNITRIGNALMQTFHTNELRYVQVIASRFYHIGRMLREPGRIRVFCGGTGCRSTGGGMVGAYVDQVYQIHLCGTGTDIATFIHEMGHAVLPRIGIRNRVNNIDESITDRAYSHERVFQFLSPEEALDNAETYGVLAEALHNRISGNVVTPLPDRVTGCSDINIPLSAFARAEQWTRRLVSYLKAMIRHISNNGGSLTDLPESDRQLLNNFLPNITDVSGLRALYSALDRIYTSSYVNRLGEVITCRTPSDQQCSSMIGLASGGSVTSSTSTNLQSLRPNGSFDLCADWFGLDEENRIKTVFVLFLLGRPSWMLDGIDMNNPFNLANYAKAAMDHTLPAPTTTHASQHVFSDSPTDPPEGSR